MSVIFKINGREVTRAEFNAYEFTPPCGVKRKGVPNVRRSYRHATPLTSEAAAVHPLDAAAAEEHAGRSGVPVHFDSLGRPEFTSMVQRDKYLKLIGMHVNGRAKYRSGGPPLSDSLRNSLLKNVIGNVIGM